MQTDPRGIPYLAESDPLQEVGAYTRQLRDKLFSATRSRFQVLKDDTQGSLTAGTDVACTFFTVGGDMTSDWAVGGTPNAMIYTGVEALFMLTANLSLHATSATTGDRMLAMAVTYLTPVFNTSELGRISQNASSTGRNYMNLTRFCRLKPGARLTLYAQASIAAVQPEPVTAATPCFEAFELQRF